LKKLATTQSVNESDPEEINWNKIELEDFEKKFPSYLVLTYQEMTR
jgi:hypothetical protein